MLVVDITILLFLFPEIIFDLIMSRRVNWRKPALIAKFTLLLFVLGTPPSYL